MVRLDIATIVTYLQSSGHVPPMGGHKHVAAQGHNVVNCCQYRSFAQVGCELTLSRQCVLTHQVREVLLQSLQCQCPTEWLSSSDIHSCIVRCPQGLEESAVWHTRYKHIFWSKYFKKPNASRFLPCYF